MARFEHEKKIAGTYRPQSLPTMRGSNSDWLWRLLGKIIKYTAIGLWFFGTWAFRKIRNR